MFKKSFKTKTSTTIKGSERKRLRSAIQNSFLNLSVDDVNSLIPNKGEMTQVKATTHSGSLVMIYWSGANPIFFEVEKHIYPTVYTLWTFPDLLPALSTVPPVLEKIKNGADLMAPGVVMDPITLLKLLVTYKVNSPVAICICGNKAPIAVGIALIPVQDLERGTTGKAVSIVHSYMDTLWAAGDQQELPLFPDGKSMNDSLDLGISTLVIISGVDKSKKVAGTSSSPESVSSPEAVTDSVPEAFTDSSPEAAADCSSEAIADSSPDVLSDSSRDACSINLPSAHSGDTPVFSENVPEEEVTVQNENPTEPVYTMDEILHHSFMTALKVSGKKISLPILSSTFYSSYVLKSCPPSLNLDIKKTSFRKLSVFLKNVQKQGLVYMKELSKGVESIVSVNLENEALKRYRIERLFKLHLDAEKDKSAVEVPSSNVQENYKFPLVTELYVISANVKTLFEGQDLRKGDIVAASAVKDIIRQYVEENTLQSDVNPREVVLDPILTDCSAINGECKEVMTWEQLLTAIISKMPNAYRIEFEGKQPLLKKGKLEPIQVTVDTRTGNKKVTLVSNLDTYGINPEKFADHVRVAVAASTSITTTQNGKSTIVLIQGNQVKYLQKLFCDVYKVPKKFIKGLDNVPSKKK